MSFRLKAWQLPIVVIAVCGVALWVLREWRARQAHPALLVQRFPPAVTTVVYVDVSALGQSGILARMLGQPGGQDTDYLRFVDETAFDFRRDLRGLMLGFSSETTYALASGTFDWDALRTYAESRNGTCRFSICRMPGYSNNRAISWAPLHRDTIALAFGADPWGAAELVNGAPVARRTGPAGSPVWMTSTGRAIRSSASWPEGARSFTRILEPAERVILAVQQAASRDLEVSLAAECKAPEVAARVARELSELTTTLNSMLEREHRQPNPSDLSGVLTAGRFKAEAQTVSGTWPLPKPFMETLLASNP